MARSVVHYRYALQHALGNKVASQELERALSETNIDADETRRSELQVLHDQLERNLTGLLGPTLARRILYRQPGIEEQTTGNSPDTRLLERRLETSREQMRGLTKQVDDLRQYLQRVLRQLPLGVCSISDSNRIHIWNPAMQELTGVDEREAYDKSLEQLSDPWGKLLGKFATSEGSSEFRCRVYLDNHHATVNLHKADLGIVTGNEDSLSGQVILVEDRTSLDTLESELAHSERLASVGRLAAGVAHEIGNPLTGIASIAQNLHHDIANTDNEAVVREQTDDILSQVNRINRIVRSLLTFSHADAVSDTQYEPVNIAERVDEALRLVKLSPDTHGLRFGVSVPSDTWVLGDPNLLTQVFVNLINNACDASPPAGLITIHGHINNRELTIETIDEGSGVDDAVREQIFEPFFTTKPVGQGTGLGLSLAYSIVSNHNGKLRIGDSDTGTRMVVTLPLVETS